MQLLAVQRELEIALLEAAFGILGLPVAAVPELTVPPPYSPFGNRAFEVAIVERMVLDLDRQPLVMRIERGPLVTAQDLNTPSNSSRRS